jgi:isoquinoline 1-oxidoreductase
MKKNDSKLIAPEQYELKEKRAYNFRMNRRSFFEIMGSGLVVTFAVVNNLSASSGDETIDEGKLSAWIHIGESGTVTIYTGKAEVGQNIRTSLAQIVAEELHVPIESIDMVMGDTALTPYDRGTFGSRSIPYMGPQLRKAAASARELLINMAAQSWNSDKTTIVIEQGIVKDKSTNKSTTLGKLTEGKKLVANINDNVATIPVDQWKVAGTSVLKVRGASFITGKHKYVSDMKLPDMLYGKVLRAPAYGATVVSVDLSGAKRIPGVVAVHDGDFIGVAATDMSTASKALKAIKVEWKTTPQPSRSEIFEYLKKHAEKAERSSENGDTTDAFAKADIKIEQTFYVDYIAHAPLEPRAGLAQWTGNKLTVWTGTQRPFGVQEDLAEAFNIPKDNIRVIQPDTGSGYGGKHTGEAGIEAARLSKEAGKPVKVVWTREEEFTWAYFRPAGVIEVTAGASKDGIVTSWEFHNYNSGGSGIETPYVIGNKKIEFHPVASPLRQGSYRGLAATANHFARESAMNDLAVDLKIDPLEFRIKNLRDERMIAVLKATADKFGWAGYKRSSNRGIGIACGFEKAGYVATAAEVSVEEDTIRVLRVVAAFECGAIINPEHLKNQIQGSVIQGLGGALFERVDFKEGKILNPSFSRYRVPRFGDTPLLEVVMLNRTDIPSAGAGETPILGIAPAIRNAVVNATGKRLYALPMDKV